MLVLMMGIVSIPVAFMVGSIPVIALHLILSLPFYYAQYFLLKVPVILNILISVVLSVATSAALSSISQSYLIAKGEALTASDERRPLEVQGKSIVVFDHPRNVKCNDICQTLLLIGGAKDVTLNKETFRYKKEDFYYGNSFRLIEASNEKCQDYAPRGLTGYLHDYARDKGLCIAVFQNAKTVPDFAVIEREEIYSFESTSPRAFNPFTDAIDAERTLVLDLNDQTHEKVIQITGVEINHPIGILAPYAIADSQYADGVNSLIRKRLTLKEIPNVEQLLFTEAQLSKARATLMATDHRNRLLSLLARGDLDEQERTLVLGYANAILLEGHDRSSIAFDIAAALIGSPEFRRQRMAPRLVDALKPDSPSQWTPLARSLFDSMDAQSAIAHATDLVNVRNYMLSVGREIASLPKDQLLNNIERLKKLANDPVTIDASYTAFRTIHSLEGQAKPILRSLFRSSRSALESSAKRPDRRMSQRHTSRYKTFTSELCRLSQNSHVDAEFIDILLNDGTTEGDLEFLKSVSLTDYKNFKKLSVIQDENYIFTAPPGEIISDFRNGTLSNKCKVIRF